MICYKLYAALTLDTSEYEDRVKQAKNDAAGLSASMGKMQLSAQKLGSKLKSGLTAALKVTATAAAAATAAVSALVKSGVEGYAEYEQLVGGVP